MQNSSATARSGCIQCQLNNTTAVILVLKPKLRYPKVVMLLENQDVPSIVNLSPEQFLYAFMKGGII